MFFLLHYQQTFAQFITSIRRIKKKKKFSIPGAQNILINLTNSTKNDGEYFTNTSTRRVFRQRWAREFLLLIYANVFLTFFSP